MSERLVAIEYIRGLAMLGVIGIHTGAWMLSNPAANIHLFAVLEICSRFSVPIFFFITAFGMYYRPQGGELTVSRSTRLPVTALPWKRLYSVLLPYITWSLLYMGCYTLLYQDDTIWQAPLVWRFLFFGLASYQLYFLVILLMFLLLTPLLQPLAVWLAKRPAVRLGGLLLLQIAFNYYSSYLWKGGGTDSILGLLVEYRLSYLPFHYLWIFMLGAVCALRYEQTASLLRQRQSAIAAWFWGSFAAMLFSYYTAVLLYGFSLERAAFTFHQLSPVGVVYTGAAAFYLARVFSKPLPQAIARMLDILSRHSFFIFLVHPFVMSGLQELITLYNLKMTVPVTILFYWSTVGISLLLSVLFQAAGRVLPAIPLLLTGKGRKQAVKC